MNKPSLVFLPLLGMLVSLLTGSPQPGAPGLGDVYYPEWGNGGYDVKHYRLDLSVDMAHNVLSAVAFIQAEATQSLSSFNLDFLGFTVREVAVNGCPADYHRDGRELTIMPPHPLPKGESFTTKIVYDGVPQPILSEAVKNPPDPIGWLRYEQGVCVLAEPSGAAAWFPCNDHPLDKASYTFNVTVPKPYLVAANGVLRGTIDGSETVTYLWEEPSPMSSYLATVNVADFVIQRQVGPAGLPIRHYIDPDLVAKASPILQRTPEMVVFFSRLLGPYPFEALGTVTIDCHGETFPAMEAQTMILMFRNVFADPTVAEVTLAHEIAHHWLGNSVSLKQWKDLWLKEGFATYAQWLWVEHRWGRQAFGTTIRRAYQEAQSLYQDVLPGSPPVNDLYHLSVYQRGGLTLHALRRRMGDERFFRLLRVYTDRYRHSHADTADFIAIAEEVSGQELDGLFEAWLYRKGVPPMPGIELQ